MTIQVKLPQSRKLKKFFAEAGSGGVSSVEVGFFEGSRYQETGTPVTTVAAANEFGTQRGILERPFFRNAVNSFDLADWLEVNVDHRKLVIQPPAARRLGLTVKAKIQNSIRELKTPPNASATVARKGSSNPLIDTGTLINSVTFKINR